MKLTMQGLRRVKGVAAKPKAALRVEHVKAVVAAMPGDLVGIRDTAIVLLGFVAGMRRSEIVALDVDAVAFEPEGIVISIRKSKRDQEGKGRQVAVPRGRHEATCPVRAVRRWLDVSGIQNGPLFVRLDPGAPRDRLSGKSVALIVKRVAARAGIDPVLFSGHSLRRGFCTEAARAGGLPPGARARARQPGPVHRSVGGPPAEGNGRPGPEDRPHRRGEHRAASASHGGRNRILVCAPRVQRARAKFVTTRNYSNFVYWWWRRRESKAVPKE